jgi:phage shock protein PspC (stress-responsive transcriptional regulator)
MYRSFDQRILGGVCGGFAELTRLPASLFRAVFLIASLLTLGFALLVYLALWWILPLRVPTRARNGSFIRLLLSVAVIVAMAVLWVGRDMAWLMSASGVSLFLPLTLVVLGLALVMRQAAV